MPAEFRLTDAIDASILTKLENISTALANVAKQIDETSDAYANLSRNMAGGLGSKPGDIDALEKKFQDMNSITRQLEQTQKQLAASQQSYEQLMRKYQDTIAEAVKRTNELNNSKKETAKIVNQTTPAISRELAEQEKQNKASREEYTINKQALEMAREILGTRQANTKALVEYKQQLAEINARRKSVNQAEEDGIITEQQALEKKTQLLAEERSLKVAMSETQKILKIEEKMAQEASGSYAELSQQLSLMKYAYKQLNEEEKNRAGGQTLYNEINDLDAHLKDLAADMGEFQRNVGNYAIANANLRKEMRDLTMEIASLTMQYRGMSDAEKQSETGVALHNKLQQLTAKASTLRDTMADVNREISSGASDTKNWDALAGQLGIVSAGFVAATAGAKALGLAEEETKEVQASAVAVLAFANQARSVQNTLQKESALMKGISNIQQKALNKSEEIGIAVQGKGIIVTKAATLAQAAFNAVAKANPYVLLATALVTVVGAIAAFTLGTKKAEKNTEQMNKELERSKNALQEVSDKADFDIRIAEAAGASTKELRKMRFEAAMAANEMANIAKNDAFKKYRAGQIDKDTYQEYVKQEDETYKKLQKVQQDNEVERVKEATQAERDIQAARTKAAQDAARARLEKQQEQAAYMEDIAKQLAQAEIDIMTDGQEREKAQINASFNEKMNAIRGNSEDEEKLRILLETQRFDALLAIDEKYEKQRTEMEKQMQDERMDAITETLEKKAKENDIALAIAQEAIKQQYAKQEIDEKTYREESARLSTEYARKAAQATIYYLEEELKSEQLTAEQRMELDEELAKAKIELSNRTADIEIENLKRVQKQQEDNLKGAMEIINIAADTVDGISSFADQLFQNQIEKMASQSDALDKAYDEEIKRIESLAENGSISVEEAEARKRAAEDQTNANKEKITRRQEQLERKQAKLAKASAISQATMNTALAILNVWADAGNGNFISRGIMAGIVGALGAMQLATIIATPLAAYAKGTDDANGGPSLVGDGGMHEIVMYNGKAWLTPDTPTLVNLPAHARVIPDVDMKDLARVGSDLSLLMKERGETAPSVIVNNDYRQLEKRMENNTQEIRELRKIINNGMNARGFQLYMNSRI